MFKTMTNDRIISYNENENKAYNHFSINHSPMIYPYYSFGFTMVPKDGQAKEALNEVLGIIQTLLEKGFSKTELIHARANILLNLKSQLKNDVSKQTVLNQCINNFIEGKVITSRKETISAQIKMLNNIKVDDLNNLLKQLYVKNNICLSIVTGDQNCEDVLSKEYVEEALNRTDLYNEIKSEENIVIKPLLSKLPKGGSVTKKEDITRFGAEIWTLSNRAKVVYRYSSSARNVVGFWGESKGGTSVLPKSKLLVANMVPEVLNGGMGEHDKFVLKKILSNSEVFFNIGLTNINEQVTGYCTNDYFENLMQLCYMAFETPRFDQKYLNIKIREQVETYKKLKGTANVLISNQVKELLSNGNRLYIPTEEDYENLKVEDIAAVYKDRFRDASDWTFYIIGDIAKKKAQKLASKYLGSFEDINREESFVNHDEKMKDGYNKFELDVELGNVFNDNMIAVENDLEYTKENNYCLDYMTYILQKRLSNVIREQEGGTYNVAVSKGSYRTPTNLYTFTVKFKCAPENKDKLVGLARQEIRNMKLETVSNSEIEEVKTTYRKAMALTKKGFAVLV